MKIRKVIESLGARLGDYIKIEKIPPENRFKTLDIGAWEPYGYQKTILDKYNFAQSKADRTRSDNVLNQLRYWNLTQCTDYVATESIFANFAKYSAFLFKKKVFEG